MSGIQQQLPDGRWVDATPLPYFKDYRPWYVRIWHCLGALVMSFWLDDDLYETWRDRLDDKWLVPEEKSAAERGLEGDK
jgi:hypothetical protein